MGRENTVYLVMHKLAIFLIIFINAATAGADLFDADFGNIYVQQKHHEGVEIAEEYNQPLLTVLNEPHQAISNNLEFLARKVDNYFAGSDQFYEETGSYLRLITGFEWKDSEGFKYDGDLKAKIDLPATKSKYQLLIETNPKQILESSIDKILPDDSNSDQSIYAGIQSIFTEYHNWDLSLSAGIKFRIPPDPYTRLRAHRRFLIGSWESKFTQSIFWFNSEGFGTKSNLRFDRHLFSNFLFRSTCVVLWRRENGYANFEQIFSLFQYISNRTLLAYDIGLFATSEDTSGGGTENKTSNFLHVTNYLLQFRYRHKIHKDWIFLNFILQTEFIKDEDFEPEPSIRINFEFIFGKKYVSK